MGENLPFQKKNYENERNSIKKKNFPLGAVKNILSRYLAPTEGTKTVEVRDCHSGLEIFAGLLGIDEFLYFAGTIFWNVQ